MVASVEIYKETSTSVGKVRHANGARGKARAGKAVGGNRRVREDDKCGTCEWLSARQPVISVVMRRG
jgi:hypothetical protein